MKRWPGWVYDEGEDPDYRFSFANERTFLAWLRTGLALIAAGVAIDVVDLSLSDAAERALAGALVALGMVAAMAAWFRWAQSERAMRRNQPLPPFGIGAAVTLTLVAISLTLIIFGL